MLDWVGVHPAPTPEDIALLARLPPLRCLLAAVHGMVPADLELRLTQALPGLESLTVGSMELAREEGHFFQAAAASRNAAGSSGRAS